MLLELWQNLGPQLVGVDSNWNLRPASLCVHVNATRFEATCS